MRNIKTVNTDHLAPVALIFFNRPDPLSKVFASIKKAKPAKLFLIQDGPRIKNESDAKNIALCREVVSNIDWECEVHHNYSDINLGCGERVISGISWAFEFVDRLCIIEDDCVPGFDFYRFCAEMLDKYADDDRIDMISGMNNLEVYNECEGDYFFSTAGSIWGWATWKRCWDTIDFNMDFVVDDKKLKLLKCNMPSKRLYNHFIKSGKSKREQQLQGKKLSSWSYQKGMNMFLNSRLIIVPKKNLVTNVGLTPDSVHAVDDVKKLPKVIQKLFFMPVYRLPTELSHPQYIMDDKYFRDKVNSVIYPPQHISLIRRLEGKARQLISKFL